MSVARETCLLGIHFILLVCFKVALAVVMSVQNLGSSRIQFNEQVHTQKTVHSITE